MAATGQPYFSGNLACQPLSLKYCRHVGHCHA